jgi:cytochrome c oxidase cbb3-type subunit II
MTRIGLILLGAIALMVFALIILVVIPVIMNPQAYPESPLVEYSASEARGRRVYIAEGCIMCHSQQVRDPSFTTDEARGWGRASVPADYVHDRPHLMGTSRTGPDLINVGARLPNRQWQLLHLYQPRALVPWSIMPSYPYLFRLVDHRLPEEVAVDVPAAYAVPGRIVVATQDALDLVDYLLSLDRTFTPPAIPGYQNGGRSNGQ